MEISSAKFALLRALDDRNEDLKTMVASAMDRALPEIQSQLDDMVRVAVHQALASAVRDAAAEAVERVSSDTAAKLTSAIEEAVNKKFKK